MRRHIVRVTLLSILSVVVVAAAVVAAVYIRLSSGPIAIGFLREAIQSRINQNLTGMAIGIDGVVIERTPGSGLPHLHLSGLVLRDARGNLIARAPRAAIGIEEAALFRGSVVPRTLELIGPRIFITRTLQGGVQLGFGASEAGAPPQPETPAQASPGAAALGKSDQESGETSPGGVSGNSLMNILSADSDSGASSIGTIDDIKVSNAAIRLYDEANNAVWLAPSAQLSFKRTVGGFVVVTTADVATNAGSTATWHCEMSATYQRSKHLFVVAARIDDLVPADISSHVYALSQLAQVQVPLSGQAAFEVTDTGEVRKASAEFTAAAGKVGLPDFIAEPIIVDEGSLRADYDPATGGISIADSSLLVGSSRADLSGTINPVRSDDGRLTAIDIDLKAHNVAIDAQGTIKSPVLIDHVDFSGRAAIDAQRLDVNDLVVMAGNSGVRVRGVITGGDESAGLLMSGRIRDVSTVLLKKLWPPVVAPSTRAWIDQNISEGRIADGGFQISLPSDAMARAKRDLRLPANSLSMSLNLAGVTSGYFKSMPPLENASGTAVLKDNDFTLQIDGATVALPSGKTLTLNGGQMATRDILAAVSPTTINVDVSAPINAVLEYLGLPDLNLGEKTGFQLGSKMAGNARVQAQVDLPLMADIPDDQVQISAKAKLSDASIKGALPKIDITAGQFDLTYDHGAIAAAGPAKINGVEAKIGWKLSPDKQQSATIQASLKADDRARIGADLSSFLDGPVAVKVAIDDLNDPQGAMTIDADLSKAALHLDAINWARDATAKTRAAFNYFGKGDKGRRIEGLSVAGPGLSIKGDVYLQPNGGLREAKLSEVNLSDENRFALDLKNGDAGTSLSISGDSFDARPLITSMFKAAPGNAGNSQADAGGAVSITANLERIYAHRGEIISGISGNITTRGGQVQAAELSGTFLSGQPVVMRLTPTDAGRDLQVLGRDGGAALRAANLYSKIAGGQIEFHAVLANNASSSVRNGNLVLRNFEVRNEAALAQLDTKGTPKKNGPRAEGLTFYKLSLPFSTDAQFVKLGETFIKGNDLGGVASGLIRKADGAIDITGTVFPAYALNSVLSNIPLVGQILSGGQGEGIFGVTFALGGSMAQPRFQVNPMSAITPGILRKFLEFSNGASPSQAPRNGKNN